MFLQGLGTRRSFCDSVNVDGSFFSKALHRAEGQGTSEIPCLLLHPIYYIILCAHMCLSLDFQIISTIILDVYIFAFSDFKLVIFQVII